MRLDIFEMFSRVMQQPSDQSRKSFDGIYLPNSNRICFASAPFFFFGLKGFRGQPIGRISHFPEQPCWLYAWIALHHTPEGFIQLKNG